MKNKFNLKDNRSVLHREVINDLLVKLFHQILDLESDYLNSSGVDNLSMSEFNILSMISRNINPTMSEIAKSVTLTNGTVTTAIGKLSQKGFVIKVKDEQDRRINRVKLTNKGLKAANVRKTFYEDMVGRICEDTSTLDDENLIESLQKLVYFFEEIKDR